MRHIWRPGRFFLQITYKHDRSWNTSVPDATMAAEVLLLTASILCQASPSMSQFSHSGNTALCSSVWTFIFQRVWNQQSFSSNSSVPHEKATQFASQHVYETLLAALHTGERNKNHTNPTHAVLLTFIKFSFWIPKYFIFVSEDIIMDIELVWNRSLSKRNTQCLAYQEYQHATKGWTTDVGFRVHADILQ